MRGGGVKAVVSVGANEGAVDQDLIIESDVMVPMRDGIRLRTEIYRPTADGTYPVVLIRYPYESAVGIYEDFALSIARQGGYAVGLQFCRGRGGSEGTFYAFTGSDVEDGYDFVEWAAVQQWSNGKVAVVGASYSGFSTWAAAVRRPPHLVAIVPASAQWNYTEGNSLFYYAPGVLCGHCLSWTASMTSGQAEAHGVPAPIPEYEEFHKKRTRARESVAGTMADSEAYQRELAEVQSRVVRRLLAHRPLRELPEFELTPWYRDWCDHEDRDDPYWRKVSARDHLEELDLPILHVGGWYDYFVKGTLDAFQTMKKYGITEEVRNRQRLVMRPWNHNGRIPRPDADPGDEGWIATFLPGSPEIRFLDHYMKGDNPGYERQAPVQLYVMGDNCWRDEQEWPLARTEWTAFYLHSQGAANTTSGDGSLSTDAPAEEPIDSFIYDPADPVPGDLGLGRDDPQSSVDVGEVGLRSDVLVYTTPPLSADLEITGPVTLELWASSSVLDTDFTAKLIDVFADGEPVTLCQGVVRTAKATAQAAVPGAVYHYDIDLWATSNVFKAGHRIQLYISSSEFPTYELNPNTGGRITHDPTGETVPATQHVFHDTTRPSRLILPVIPR